MVSNGPCTVAFRQLKQLSLVLLLFLCQTLQAGELRCGAAAVDVSPRQLPVIRNGGFLQAQDDMILDPLHARCLALDDGRLRIAIVVVDSCMLPLDVCDEAKRLAARATGMDPAKIMIAATHTHSAPSVMEYCLGSGCDEEYRNFLPGKIAEAVRLAFERCRPARVGWTRVDAAAFTKCRRWITRSDQWQQDPFGERSVNANMHPGHQNPNFIGPSGPVDPWLSLLMVTSDDGQPIAALANFSMHYFSGHSGVSADYYGRFAKALESKLGAENHQFVGIMSQGTSGDLWWGDYGRAREEKPFQHMNEFADGLAQIAIDAISDIEYHADVPLGMVEKRMTLGRRIPDEGRLAWARRLNELRGDRLPQDRPEVYAMQAVHLHENPTDEVVLQAIRIGEMGITGMPNEVYALTGLKLKRRSPLDLTWNMSLANGACGYIPPPEQHALGGYTTWPATTAGLEVAAEPKIVNSLLGMLEQIAQKPAKVYREPDTEFSRHVLRSNPYAYWRLAEMEQSMAVDETGNNRSLRFDGLVAFHLPGRIGDGIGKPHDSHAVQLAGGKLVGESLQLGESYSIQFSFLIGTPTDFRGTTAVLFSRGDDELIVIGTDSETPGRLMCGGHLGQTQLHPQQWHHVVFVRNGDFVQIFLDGSDEPEISVKTPRTLGSSTLWLGGNAENTANLEGKLDEVSVYDRAITAGEISSLYRAAGRDWNAKDEPTSDALNSTPLDPEASSQCIHVRDGYAVELVASEPLVQDPVAIDWGLDGKLWVAEMADYPMGMDGQGKPGGRIRFLEDTDGDGNYDAATVFLDDVRFPNGVMAWKDGVLVTAAPEIFYAEDTTGDGKADVKEVLFSGFMQGNQQLRVNGLRWGLDNLVHCASGAHHAGFGAGNAIFSAKKSTSITVGSRDFRFDPRNGFLDPQSGPSQFGRVRNDWGDWFGVQNSWPLWHYVLQDHYLRRNTKVPSIDPRQQVRLPRMPEVYSAKPPQRRFHGFDHAGHYTSACGISIYRDELLFPRDEIHAFTCAPFHNLVQHHVLQVDGVSYQGRRADDGPIDFFASTDRWTRPVMSRTGPDGALWVVDMYRYMIEHPQWLPKEGQEALRPGYRAGENLGRIYRVVRKDVETRPVDLISDAEDAELVEMLRHPNGIVRDLAHRALLLSQDKDSTESIQTIVADPTITPQSRIQALSLLAGLDACDADTVRFAAKDSSPHLRRFAIRLAEGLGSSVPAFILQLARDPDPAVRLQLATSLGEWNDPAAGETLFQLAIDPKIDPFTQAAVISSLPKHYQVFVDSALAANFGKQPAALVDALLLLGEDHPRELARLLIKMSSTISATHVHPDSDGALAARLAHWMDSLQARNKSVADWAKEHPAWADAKLAMDATAMGIRERLEESKVYRANQLGLLGRDAEHLASDIQLLAGGMDGVDEFTAFRRQAGRIQVLQQVRRRLTSRIEVARDNRALERLHRIMIAVHFLDGRGVSRADEWHHTEACDREDGCAERKVYFFHRRRLPRSGAMRNTRIHVQRFAPGVQHSAARVGIRLYSARRSMPRGK